MTQFIDEKEVEARTEQLVAFLELVLEWNVRGNLISAADNTRIVDRHALDALAAIPLVDELSPKRVLDLGSGGGFPGVPIKICRPGLELALVESRRMKSLFLLRVVRELALQGAAVWQVRIEHLGELPSSPPTSRSKEGAALGDPGSEGDALRPDLAIEPPTIRPEVDLVTVRAVARLARVAAWTAPLVRTGGHLLAYKGSRLEEELAEWRTAPAGWSLLEIREEVRPQTHFVVLRRSDSA